jgi:hypothetical protein
MFVLEKVSVADRVKRKKEETTQTGTMELVVAVTVVQTHGKQHRHNGTKLAECVLSGFDVALTVAVYVAVSVIASSYKC